MKPSETAIIIMMLCVIAYNQTQDAVYIVAAAVWLILAAVRAYGEEES